MQPQCPLPLHPQWNNDTQAYTACLLNFLTISNLHRNLCGGVHILDFLTRKPDLYKHVLPADWRAWLEGVQIDDFLDLLMREDVGSMLRERAEDRGDGKQRNSRGNDPPPTSLLEYIYVVRMLNLDRTFRPESRTGAQAGSDGANYEEPTLPRHIAVGMKPKKAHEVAHFSSFVNRLCEHVSKRRRGRCNDADYKSTVLSAPDVEPVAGSPTSTDPVIIDFGSGQAYLGRTLASPPYNKHVIAIEGREHNVEGAKGMDVHAKIAVKEKIWRNKKVFKRLVAEGAVNMKGEILDQAKLDELEQKLEQTNGETENARLSESETERHPVDTSPGTTTPALNGDSQSSTLLSSDHNQSNSNTSVSANPQLDTDKGSIVHMTHSLTSGNLPLLPTKEHPSIVVSLHSCGNLTHHGLRSLVLNPSVKAVALIGCCYNLLTERLGPPTYKLPQLRSMHPRLKETSEAHDQAGFPMSKAFEDYEINLANQTSITSFLNYLPAFVRPSKTDSNNNQQTPSHLSNPPAPTEKGIRLNITSRMMAVQAPSNWGPTDSATFFTRHFYRALLQRILLDHDVVKMPAPDSEAATSIEIAGGSLSGADDIGTPLVIGSLRKSAFDSFEAYVTAAVSKLVGDGSERAAEIARKMGWVFERRDVLAEYEREWAGAKHRLSVIWSLMAFSAGVVESAIVVDRWMWLGEQGVRAAWVQVGFEGRLSPRNLVVVGLKPDDSRE